MKAVSGTAVRLAEVLGLLDPLESSEAELAALEDQEPNELFENDPIKRPKKKKKRAAGTGKPRDELGRFTKPRSKK